MLAIEILNDLENLILSDRMTFRGNELQGVSQLLIAIRQEKAVVQGITRTQPAPASELEKK